MKRTGHLIASLFCLSLLAGCGATPTEGPADGSGPAMEPDSMNTEYLNGPSVVAPNVGDGSLGAPSRPTALTEPEHRIHFGFNSALISEEASRILIQNAQWILANNPREIVVEGHCDERGTRDFNLALGQERADAVKQYLVSQGVDWYRVRTVSYGKERPLVHGHDEFAWAKNRRSEIRLISQ